MKFLLVFRKIPLAFFLCLGLLVATEFFVRQYAPVIRSFSDSVILYKKKILEDKRTSNFDGLLMGDSRILGVDAKLVSNMVTNTIGRRFEFSSLMHH